MPRLHWAPLTADGTVSDGDLLDDSDGLRAIHAPGHSPGHIVLFHEPSRAVLMGDAAFNRGKLALGPAALAADPDLRPGAASPASRTTCAPWASPTALPHRRRGRHLPTVRSAVPGRRLSDQRRRRSASCLCSRRCAGRDTREPRVQGGVHPSGVHRGRGSASGPGPGELGPHEQLR
ncbi:MBL fold metallo-hydrolase [Streptomyces sp. NPDC058251]|uniref:MBL fold metallo-hydrolase n=1 Tax=Streptomyces sp. NPDC058251 TaxID=3346404 RepID=UPI0036E9C082